MPVRFVRSLVALALTLCAVTVGAEYRVEWSVIGNGGGFSSGPNFSVEGTIGQPLAATSACTTACPDAGWEVTSGYWVATPCDSAADAIFCSHFDP
jgi:hypothetical protein